MLDNPRFLNIINTVKFNISKAMMGDFPLLELLAKTMFEHGLSRIGPARDSRSNPSL